MSRFTVMASSVSGVVAAGIIALAFTLPPDQAWLAALLIAVTVLGANATTGLAARRVAPAVVPRRRTPVPSGWSLVGPGSGLDWSAREQPAEGWSSSWDYADSDGSDDADDRWDRGPRFDRRDWYHPAVGPHASGSPSSSRRSARSGRLFDGYFDCGGWDSGSTSWMDADRSSRHSAGSDRSSDSSGLF